LLLSILFRLGEVPRSAMALMSAPAGAPVARPGWQGGNEIS